MHRQTEKNAQAAQLAANKDFMSEMRCHQTYNLKGLLVHKRWLIIKIYIVFKKRKGESNRLTRTMYGNEHACTYKQCLAGYRQIELSPARGYALAVQYVEEDLKGEWDYCQIFYDSKGDHTFPTVTRHYEKGKLKTSNDPILSEDEVRPVPFSVEDGRLIIADRLAPAIITNVENIDFKKEINSSLNI